MANDQSENKIAARIGLRMPLNPWATDCSTKSMAWNFANKIPTLNVPHNALPATDPKA